jgi:methyltransferase (TIGR00027 family)
MTGTEPLIRNISDTARWVAFYRAKESERPDALFRDPFARRLAGERGEQIARSKPLGSDNGWPMVTRTVLIDELIAAEVKRGADAVINLAAGLDTRPYRMQLPASLNWLEIDLPEILAYKEEILREEQPVCRLQRLRLDLSDAAARKELFSRLATGFKNAVILTEGLLIYLTQEQVASLAQDLSAAAGFQSWILDLTSPALLRALTRRMKPGLRETAPFRFAPREGPEFFAQFGWDPVEARNLLQHAGRLKRLPFPLNVIALLPGRKTYGPDRPWGGICLFRKKGKS